MYVLTLRYSSPKVAGDWSDERLNPENIALLIGPSLHVRTSSGGRASPSQPGLRFGRLASFSLTSHLLGCPGKPGLVPCPTSLTFRPASTVFQPLAGLQLLPSNHQQPPASRTHHNPSQSHSDLIVLGYFVT